MKILITGAGGFIGNRLTTIMSEQDNVYIHGIGRKQHGTLQADYQQMDVRDNSLVENLIRMHSFDVIIHLAAVTFHDDIVAKKQASLKASLLGTENLITAFNKYCKKSLFVYASSGKVYGSNTNAPITEDTPPSPYNALGMVKKMTEDLINYYSSDNPSNKCIALRIFNVYGLGQRDSFVIPHILKSLMGKVPLVLGDVNNFRDYIHVSDVTRCIREVIIQRKNLSSGFSFFNVGAGVAHSVGDIITIMESIVGYKINFSIDKVRKRPDEHQIEVSSIEKIKNLLGWQPQICLSEGLRQILKTVADSEAKL